MKPSNKKPTEKEIKYLQRLLLAEQSMRLVAAACDAELKRGKPASKEERDVLAAGIAAYYASPFTEANGIGALPEEFGKFDDANLAKTHSVLMSMRHQKYAHRDKRATGTTTTGEEWSIHNIEVTVEANGNVRLHTRSLDWPPEMFERVKALSHFQFGTHQETG